VANDVDCVVKAARSALDAVAVMALVDCAVDEVVILVDFAVDEVTVEG